MLYLQVCNFRHLPGRCVISGSRWLPPVWRPPVLDAAGRRGALQSTGSTCAVLPTPKWRYRTGTTIGTTPGTGSICTLFLQVEEVLWPAAFLGRLHQWEVGVVP
jgi:hypothetical protein